MKDDAHYDEVARELQAKAMVPGVWTRSFAEAEGDLDRARSLYIKYRVSQLAEAERLKQDQDRNVALESARQRNEAEGQTGSSPAHKLGRFLLATVLTIILFLAISNATSPEQTDPASVVRAIAVVSGVLLFGTLAFIYYTAARGK